MKSILSLTLLCIAATHVQCMYVATDFIDEFGYDAVVRRQSSLNLIELFQALRVAPQSSGCTPGSKLSHSAAWAMCSAAGIGIRSFTGRIGCRDVGCTSLEQVRCETVLGIVAFKKASGCPIMTITGGTEKGHASGTFSHYNGYKLDIALTSCITNYIRANFRYGGKRSDGADMFIDGRGNVYALENNHWDIVYYK